MNKEQDIEKLFQDSFANFEVAPPSGLKERIDQEIQNKRGAKNGGYWFFGTLSLLILCSAWISSFYFFPAISSTQTNLQSAEIKQMHAATDSKLDQTVKSIKPVVNTRSKAQGKQKNSTLQNSSDGRSKRKEITPQVKLQSLSKRVASSGNGSKLQASSSSKKNEIQQGQGANTGTVKQIEAGLKTEKKTELAEKSITEGGNSGKQITAQENGLVKQVEGNLTEQEQALKESLTNDQDTILRTGEEVLTEELAKVSDTNNTENSSPLDSIPTTSEAKKSPLLLSLNVGSAIPFNRFARSSEFSVKEKSLFQLEAEATYFFKGNLGARTGINYYQAEQNHFQVIKTTTMDSSISHYDISYVTQDSFALVFDDSNMVIDTIIYTIVVDSSSVPVYKEQNKTDSSTATTSFISSSFGIPLLFHYRAQLGGKFQLDLMAGGIIQVQQIKRIQSSSGAPPMTSNRFGFQACLKSQLRYQFDHFGVSLNSSFSYDFSPPMLVNAKRKRALFGFGLGVHYQF